MPKSRNPSEDDEGDTSNMAKDRSEIGDHEGWEDDPDQNGGGFDNLHSQYAKDRPRILCHHATQDNDLALTKSELQLLRRYQRVALGTRHQRLRKRYK